MEPPLLEHKEQTETTHPGKSYKCKMVALIALRCALSQENFQILFLNDDTGNFVVLHQEDETFLLQFKNRNEAIPVSEADFLARRGSDDSFLQFSGDIAKVHQAYSDHKLEESKIFNGLRTSNEIYFVIFYNRDIKPCEYLERCLNDKISSILAISDGDCIYKLQTKEQPKTLHNLNDNSYLISNKNQTKNLNSLLIKEIENIAQKLNLKEFSAKLISDDFLKFMGFCEKRNDHWLTKQEVLAKISEFFLRPFELKLEQQKFSTSTNQPIQIWDEIIRSKTVTVSDFDETILTFLLEWLGSKLDGICKEPKSVWADALSEAERDSLFQKQPQMFRNFASAGTPNLIDVYKFLWMTNQVPLLLEINEANQYIDVMGILKLANYSQKIIILNKTMARLPLIDKEEAIKFFQTVADLDVKERDKIWVQMVRLQGRSGRLGQMLGYNYINIKCCDIIKILLKKIMIGNDLNPLPPDFIHRKLSKILLNLKVLAKVQNELFVIEAKSDQYLQNPSLKCHKTPYFRNVDYKRLNDYHIVIVDQSNIGEEIKKLKVIKKVIHFVTVYDPNHLEWKFSHGSTEKIKPFRVRSDVTESDMNSKFSCPLNIVSAPAGMGKSVFLDYVALQAPSYKYVLKIDLNEYLEYYKTQRSHFLAGASQHLEYFKNHIFKRSQCDNGLNNAVFQNLTKRRNVIVLLEGFQDVAPYYQETVTRIAKCIYEEGYSVWMTTRPYLVPYLEQEFNSFSTTLQPFTREEQKHILIKYFSVVPDNHLASEFLEELLNEDWCIHLHSELLANVFQNDLKITSEGGAANSVNAKFDLLQSYEKFVERQLDKSRTDVPRLHLSYFALTHLFSSKSDILAEINQELQEYYLGKPEKILEVQEIDLVNIQDVDKTLYGKFKHRTVGEFLAARWIFDNVNGPNEKSREIAQSLMQERFSKNYTFLFNLFDQLACRGFPLHLAVVTKNTAQAMRILESDFDEISKVDASGRSILHLAVIYGVEFPQLFDVNETSFNPDSQIFLERQEYNSDGILGILGRIADLKTERDILGYNSLDYALRYRSLHIAEKICENCNVLSLNLDIEMFWKRHYLGFCALLDYKYLMKFLLEYFAFSDLLQWKTAYPCKLDWKLDSNDSYMAIVSSQRCYYENVFGGNYPPKIKNYQIRNEKEYETLHWTNICDYSLNHAIVFNFKSDLNRLILNQSELNRKNGYGITSLHYATICKNMQALNILLSMSVDVNQQDVIGNAPLHLAVACSRNWEVSMNKADLTDIKFCPNSQDCEETHLAIATKLLSSGSDINMQNNAGDSPTHIALYAENFNVATLLISNKADVSLVNKEGKTVVHLAAEYGCHSILKKALLQEVDLNKEDNYGQTPLFYAARNGQNAMVELLVCMGAKTSIRNKEGCSACDIAINRRFYKLGDFLYNLENQIADIRDNNDESPPATNYDLNEENGDGSISLFDAVGVNDKETVELLISNGANVNLENKKGQNVLHLAAAKCCHSILRDILNKDVDIDKQDYDRWSPLFYAVDCGSSSVAWLLYKGANVNLKDKKGQTVLHLAVKHNFCFIVTEILRVSRDSINAQDIDGETPLFAAVRNNRAGATQMLLTYGADVKLTNKNGQKLLHLAAETCSTNIVQKILFKYKDINEQDSDGLSPLMCALDSNNFDVAKFILSYAKGANIKLTNKKGETALHLSAKHGCLYILNKLLINGIRSDTRTANGWTALFYAVFHNQMDSVKLLLCYGLDLSIRDT